MARPGASGRRVDEGQAGTSGHRSDDGDGQHKSGQRSTSADGHRSDDGDGQPRSGMETKPACGRRRLPALRSPRETRQVASQPFRAASCRQAHPAPAAAKGSPPPTHHPGKASAEARTALTRTVTEASRKYASSPIRSTIRWTRSRTSRHGSISRHRSVTKERNPAQPLRPGTQLQDSQKPQEPTRGCQASPGPAARNVVRPR